MAVKIRLKRMGKIRAPHYRVVVVDARKKRDGKVIEEIGKYHPKEEPSFIEVKSERAQYWLGVGAQPSEAVAAILKITGDWQTFKGEPGSEGTLRVAEPKRDKTEIFNEALKESASEPKAEAVTKKAKKTEAKEAEAPKETEVAKETEAKEAEAPKETEVAKETEAKEAESPKETEVAKETEAKEAESPKETEAVEASATEAPAVEDAPAADAAGESTDKPAEA